MVYYSGIDLHLRSCTISTVDEHGSLVKQQKLPNDEGAILKYFQELPGEHQAVVETTYNWYWLYDLLQQHGVVMTLAHAKYLKAICYAKVKTDKVDSLRLAQLLQMKMIPESHVLSPEMRQVRDLMRSRLDLVHKRVRAELAQQGLLAKFNLSSPEKLEEFYRSRYDDLEEERTLFDRQIKAREKQLKTLLVVNEDVQRLLAIPGIGAITAFTIYLETDGADRFATEKQYFSYCQLVPAAHNSGGKQQQRRSRDGNRYLKIAFHDAAVHAIGHYAEYREFYRRKARKKPKQLARTLVAKELARAAYHVLRERNEYRGLKGQPIKQPKHQWWPHPASPSLLMAVEQHAPATLETATLEHSS